MALTHSAVTDLSRHLMRLSIVSSSYAVSSATTSSLSLFSSKPSITLPTCGGPQVSPWLSGVRHNFTKRSNLKEARRRYKDEKDAVHCYGFTFYPRFPNHEDPPIEPAKLFMVKRIRTTTGCPWWEKKLIRRLNLENRRNVLIFKNTPTNNKTLYKIKHLIEITPITTPFGMPDSPENGFLKDNGEFVSYNPLNHHGDDMTLEKASKEMEEYNEKTIGGETLKSRLWLRWNARFDIVP